VTANHHRQTGAFVYEREKISRFFTPKCHEEEIDVTEFVRLGLLKPA
jgi:hypothetical protein